MKAGLIAALLLAVAALLANLLLADPGYAALRWGGYLVEMSVPVFVVLLAAAYAVVRGVLRLAATGSLATLKDGAPFVSLVTVATTPAGEPILLLSRLAVHTRNLEADPRASLLLVAPVARAATRSPARGLR